MPAAITKGGLGLTWVKRGEIMEAIRKLRVGNAPGSDGITPEMLKYGGEILVDWMVWICNLACKQSKVPEDWSKTIIVPLYKGKGRQYVERKVIIIGV